MSSSDDSQGLDGFSINNGLTNSTVFLSAGQTVAIILASIGVFISIVLVIIAAVILSVHKNWKTFFKNEVKLLAA